MELEKCKRTQQSAVLNATKAKTIASPTQTTKTITSPPRTTKTIASPSQNTPTTKHRRRHGYKCSACDVYCRTRFLLQNHYLEKHEKIVRYACKYDTCTYRTYRKNVMMEHVKVHLHIKKYECPHCEFNANKKSIIVNHMQALHYDYTEALKIVCISEDELNKYIINITFDKLDDNNDDNNKNDIVKMYRHGNGDVVTAVDNMKFKIGNYHPYKKVMQQSNSPTNKAKICKFKEEDDYKFTTTTTTTTISQMLDDGSFETLEIKREDDFMDENQEEFIALDIEEQHKTQFHHHQEQEQEQMQQQQQQQQQGNENQYNLFMLAKVAS